MTSSTGSSPIATRAIPALGPGASLDPRVEEVSWVAFKAIAARAAAIGSKLDLAESLRAMSDVLERTWDPGRTAALARVASTRDERGRLSLDLIVAVGVLGPRGETASDAETCAGIVETSLARFPSPFVTERTPAAPLFHGPPPRHLAAIRQRWVEASDESTTVRAVSRFDRQIESSLELADLVLGSPAPILLQASFAATTLSPEDSLWLEHEAIRGRELLERATDGANPVLARRSARVVETLVDLAESFSGPLWVGEIVVGSDRPLPRPLLRSLAACLTNELDVIHASQAAPVVAERRRIVGGYDIEPIHEAVPASDAINTRAAYAAGLPSPALYGRTLRDCFSLTEAGLAFRWPVPAGRAVPTLPSRGAYQMPAPAGLPSNGLRVGKDPNGVDIFLGPDGVGRHLWIVGGTGSGKSTFLRTCARHDLEHGRPFVLIDPHGDLSRAVRADAESLGRAVAVIDADEPATLALDLLDGLPAQARVNAHARGRAVARLIDALTSHLPYDWVGPRFRQIARAALEIMVSASTQYSVRLGDISRLLLDRNLLDWLLSEVDEPHAAHVLRHHLREHDSSGVALWVAAKFEDMAFNPGAQQILAPFGEGVAVGDALSHRIPLVVNLSAGRLSRLASGLLGHAVLASAVNHALSRDVTDREPFVLYVDEAHRFPATNLCAGLSETRKYGCSVVAAHQELSQLDVELRDGLLANAARVVFRTGIADAHAIGPLTGIPATELASLPNLHAFMQIDGLATFSIELDPPSEVPELAVYEAPPQLGREQQTYSLDEGMAAALEDAITERDGGSERPSKLRLRNATDPA